MGLAVLPPRLQTELNEVENYLLEKENNIADYHIVWADQLKADNQITRENVTQVVQKAVGAVLLVFWKMREYLSVMLKDKKVLCVLSKRCRKGQRWQLFAILLN